MTPKKKRKAPRKRRLTDRQRIEGLELTAAALQRSLREYRSDCRRYAVEMPYDTKFVMNKLFRRLKAIEARLGIPDEEAGIALPAPEGATPGRNVDWNGRDYGD